MKLPQKLSHICHNRDSNVNSIACSLFSDLLNTDIESATFDTPPLPSPRVEEMIEFSKEDIMEAIDYIKPSAAAGHDKIPLSLLKNCKNVHCTRRTHPSDLVKFFDYIVPLYEKGSRSIAPNYRPVSLTSHIIKIYERVLRKQMIRHLDNNDLLCDNQHGFRVGRSCLTQLLHHFDDIY